MRARARCLCLYLHYHLFPGSLFVRVRTRCSYALRTLFVRVRVRCSRVVRTLFVRARTHPRTTRRARLMIGSHTCNNLFLRYFLSLPSAPLGIQPSLSSSSSSSFSLPRLTPPTRRPPACLLAPNLLVSPHSAPMSCKPRIVTTNWS